MNFRMLATSVGPHGRLLALLAATALAVPFALDAQAQSPAPTPAAPKAAASTPAAPPASPTAAPAKSAPAAASTPVTPSTTTAAPAKSAPAAAAPPRRVLIVAMGVIFVGTLFVPLLNREWRPEALLQRAHTGGPVVAGLAFAIAWLPCTGPTLGAILTAASTESTVGRGGVLLAFYAAGLAVPFILSALAFSRVTGIFRFFRNHYAAITAVSGVILVAMGVLLFTNELARLNSEALKLLDNLGINFFQNV